jgi:hypothetical protein
MKTNVFKNQGFDPKMCKFYSGSIEIGYSYYRGKGYIGYSWVFFFGYFFKTAEDTFYKFNQNGTIMKIHSKRKKLVTHLLKEIKISRVPYTPVK